MWDIYYIYTLFLVSYYIPVKQTDTERQNIEVILFDPQGYLVTLSHCNIVTFKYGEKISTTSFARKKTECKKRLFGKYSRISVNWYLQEVSEYWLSSRHPVRSGTKLSNFTRILLYQPCFHHHCLEWHDQMAQCGRSKRRILLFLFHLNPLNQNISNLQNQLLSTHLWHV